MAYMEPTGRKTYMVLIVRNQNGREMFDREPYNIVEWVDPAGSASQTREFVEPVIAWSLRSARAPQTEVYHGIRVFDKRPYDSVRFTR